MTFLPNHFTRIQANWPEINPAPGVFNFTKAPSCNDAIIARADSQGRVILFDVWGWPAWVQADWTNRYAHMGEYVSAVLRHWPQIKILGAWNEPSFDQSPANVLIPGANYTNSASQLMVEYHQLVTAIYNAKQAVNPRVKLDIGKFNNFQSYTPFMKYLKSLGTWTMGDYITWHDANDQYLDPMIDHPLSAKISATPSVVHQVQWAQALFPGKLVGCDEHYSWSTQYCLESAASYRASGAAMLVEQYIPYPSPTNAGTISAIYGSNNNGQLSDRSKRFIKILTMPDDDFKKLWRHLQETQGKKP